MSKRVHFIPFVREGYIFYDYLEGYFDDKTDERNPVSEDYINMIVDKFYQDFDRTRSLLSNEYTLASLAAFLKDQQTLERKKELQILEKFYGIKPAQGKNLLGKNFDKLVIKSLNQVQTSLPQIQRIVRQVRKDEQEGSDKSSSRDFTSQAYGLWEAYDAEFKKFAYTADKSDVKDSIGKCLKFDSDYNLSVDPKVQSIYKNHIITILIKAIRTMISSTKDLNDMGQTVYDDYAELANILEKNKKSKIAEDFLKYIGIPDMVKAFEEAGKEAKRKKKGKRISKKDVVDSLNIRNKSFTRSTQGFVEEILASYLIPHLNQGKNGRVRAITSRVNEGAQASSDLVTVLSRTDISINFEKAITKTLEAIRGRTKKDVRESAEKALKDIEAMNLGDYAVIWESTKSYVLGKSLNEQGFHGTSPNKQSFQQTMQTILPFGSKTDMLINMLINTTEQTLGVNDKKEGQKSEGEKLHKDISTQLARGFAVAMFDDPQELKKQVKDNGNVIHIFRLSGTIVPLSYLLSIAARAIEGVAADMADGKSNYISIEVNRKSDEFLYYHKTDPTKTSTERWDKQRRDAESDFIFNITFAQRFKDLLQGELGDYLV